MTMTFQLTEDEVKEACQDYVLKNHNIAATRLTCRFLIEPAYHSADQRENKEKATLTGAVVELE